MPGGPKDLLGILPGTRGPECEARVRLKIEIVLKGNLSQLVFLVGLLGHTNQQFINLQQSSYICSSSQPVGTYLSQDEGRGAWRRFGPG